jgi:hypothetical protein
MNGDLGNLLTGEMGEAESRFANDDFAEAYGRRVAGRVRRRRTVRATAVGGGTMLTAGALVVGATHMPWGVLGAASRMVGTDCATPWPSAGAPTYSVTIDTDQGSLANFFIMYAATGETIVNGARQTDGTYLFTDGYDDPLSAVPGSAGFYSVELPSGVTSLDSTTALAYRSSSVETNYLRVHVPEVVVDSTDLARRASDDCYTPSPTPSAAPSLTTDIYPLPDPSLAAKPDNVIGDSPFQCGFTFPTESYGTDGLWIDDVGWFAPSDVEAAHEKLFGANAGLTFADPNALVPRVTVHRVEGPLAGGQEASGVMGTWDPTLEKVANLGLGGISVERVSAEGRTFVGVIGGKVVATGTLSEGDEAANASVLADPAVDGDAYSELMYLVDPGAALTSCDASPVDLTQVKIVAVAGVIVKHADGTVVGPTYAWLPVGKP